MRRALLLGLVALSGCALKLEDFPVAYACDHHGGDGGRQCTDDWRCGFADRCFFRDAGDEKVALDWLCEADAQCPDGWQCGVLVESRRHCQQLGVGAPSPCVVSADCQGGWRCGLSQACFDPSITDGGTDARCAADEHCPKGFRCGQEVDRERRCIALGVGADSRCVDDRGCEGGWRCDTDRQICVLVPDVLDSGHLGVVGAEVLNRLRPAPVPLEIAATRRGPLPMGSGFTEGVLIDALHDGGVLHATQYVDGPAESDLVGAWIPTPRPASEVLELVPTPAGPVVQWADRSVQLLTVDGGQVDLATDAGLLRPWTAVYGGTSPAALWTTANAVHFMDGGGFSVPSGLEIVEVVNLADTTWAFTTGGVYRHRTTGAPELLRDGGVPFGRALALTAGFLPSVAEPFFAFLVPTDGGAGLSPWLRRQDGTLDTTSEPVAVCPAGTTPVMISAGSDTDVFGVFAAVVTRCQDADGGTFTMKVRFGNGQTGIFTRVGTWAEDPVPFSGPFVVQRHAPFTRVVAGRDHLLWSSVESNTRTADEDGFALSADPPYHVVLLDRAPDAVVAFRAPGAGQLVLVAASNGTQFELAPLGLVSKFAVPDELVPLSVFSTSPDWVVTNVGVLDVKATGLLATPTMSAVPPTGTSIRAPASGVTAVMDLAGQQRTVMLVASHDTVWAADVTENVSSFYAPPARLSAVMSPTPGIALTSLTLEGSPTTAASVLTGYLTTPSQTLRFRTSDLVHWALDPVVAPPAADFPVEAWTEGGRGRVGTGDGRVWALPLMVELSQPFDAGTALDFGRMCGDLFAANSTHGLVRARPSPDGGLPGWVRVDEVNAQFPEQPPSRIYETLEGLVVGTRDGRLVRLTATCP